MKTRIVALFVALCMLFALSTACSFSDPEVTDNSVTALRYDGGHTSGRKFKECVPAGTKLVTDDKLYPYPNTQRQDLWDSSNKEADHRDMGDANDGQQPLTDNSGVALTAKVNVQFFLNTSCTPVKVGDKTYPGGTLQAFHELVGKTRHAYFNDDGTYPDGWLTAMNYYISAPVTQYLNTATKQYTAQQLWLNQRVDDPANPGTQAPVQQIIANGLTEALPGLVNENMETDLQFYKDFKVNIIGMTPTQDYLDLFKKRQQAQVEAQTAQDNAAAQVAEAEAQAKVEKQKALTLQQVISGYGSVQAYLEYLAIQAGINPFQPSGVITSGQSK